jgi:transcriptional regulator with XRE-family HTH domain
MVTEKQIAENRIKAILAEQKRTGKWLARAIGKSDNTVSRWCSNKTQPSIQKLLDIAQTLEVDVRSLIKSNI